jgi:polysaccharide pyruvyl transferase WcaK-like protein
MDNDQGSVSRPLYSSATRTGSGSTAVLRPRSTTEAGERPRVGAPGGSRPTIVLLGNYGHDNLGDESSLAAATYQLRRLRPDVHLVVLSHSPNDTGLRHGLEAFPINRAARRAAIRMPTVVRSQSRPVLVERAGVLRSQPWLKRPARVARSVLRVLRATGGVLRDPLFEVRAWRRLRGVDVLLHNGGGPLMDHWGATTVPLMYWKWSVLARLAGARVALLTVGAGPLRLPLARMLVRSELRLADRITVRDAASGALLSSIGVREPIQVCPDVAFGLEPRQGHEAPDSTCRTVALHMFPYRDPRFWPSPDVARYRAYLDCMSRFTGWVLEEGHGVILVPTHLQVDNWVLDDLEDLLRDPASGSLPSRLERPPIDTLDELLAQLGRADITVAARFHAILLGLFVGHPVLGIANEQKMQDVMGWLGQRRYSVPIDSLDLEELKELFGQLCANAGPVTAEILARLEDCRALVEDEFAAMLADTAVTAGVPVH